MKVLHLISGGDVGGAKTHVITLLKEMQKHIDVKLICFMKGEAFYSDAIQNNINIQILQQNKRYDLRVIHRLLKIIREERFDIIHAHGARANFIIAMIKGRIKIPVVTTIHSDYLLDFDTSIYKKIVYTGLNILSLKFLDYQIAVSENFKNMLLRRGYQEENIFIVYNGIDFEEKNNYGSVEEFLKKYGLEKSKKEIFVGIIGRLDKVKGHEVFIKAAAQVVNKAPHVRFLLAGDGEEKESLIQLTKQLNIEKNVIFLGFIENIYDFIHSIEINTLTSHSESFPYALLEGAKMKKATISSSVGGIPDLIKDGENGYLFEANNHTALAGKLLKLVFDEDLRIHFGEKLYGYAKEHFSSKSLASTHIEIYCSILQKEKQFEVKKGRKR